MLSHGATKAAGHGKKSQWQNSPQQLILRMADVFTPEHRSRVMAAIKGRGNKATELRLIAIMRAAHLTGWRRNALLPGKPDFVFPRHKVAVFVDGCFWHGCPSHGRRPASNAEYWMAKIDRNRRRDREVARLLKARGWRILRIWEHALKHPTCVTARLARMLQS